MQKIFPGEGGGSAGYLVFRGGGGLRTIFDNVHSKKFEFFGGGGVGASDPPLDLCMTLVHIIHREI